MPKKDHAIQTRAYRGIIEPGVRTSRQGMADKA